jgi:glycosyltransferase involved in cell wall biosynthesis
LFTWRGRPIARVQLSPEPGTRTISRRRIQAEISAKCARALWAKTLTSDLMENDIAEKWPPISVAVCTRDRPQSLARCLRSLQQLDYPHFEVTVVDNCSRDTEVAEVIRRSGFRYVREERPGLDWARNRAISEASHDLIAFIDDDAVAGRRWLKGIARAFQDPEVMAVTGLILPDDIETTSQSLFEQYGGMARGLEPRTFHPETMEKDQVFPTQNCGAGANMAFRRALFEKITLFDTTLDAGTVSGGCGDLDMFYRVLAAGFTLRYQPDAWVLHTHRREFDGLRRQLYANGRSYGVYLLKRLREGGVSPTAWMRASYHWFIGWICERFVRGVFARRSFYPRTLLWAELSGALSAPWAYYMTYRNDRRPRRRVDQPETFR